MFNASNKHVSSVYFAIKFNQDTSIRVKQAKIEDAYKKLFQGQSINTNIPDNDVPDKPRILLNDKKKQLLVSQETAQLALRFDGGISLADQFVTLKKYIELMMQGTSEFIDRSNLIESGIVAVVNYPSKENELAMNLNIYNNFIKAKPLGDIASAGVKLGFKTDELFINLEINVYETREGAAKISNKMSYIKVTDLPVKETGIQVKLDVNNRPQQKVIFPDTGLLLLSKVESLVTNELDDFLSME